MTLTSDTLKNDVIGQAILDFSKAQNLPEIKVISDVCEDDVIPVQYLFRSFKEMPTIEQKALELSGEKILDIGAGAGCHSKWLLENKKEVLAIETSTGAIEYLKSRGIPAIRSDINEYSSKSSYDTILLLMNGIGIAGTINKLPLFLEKLADMLSPKGQILLESTDIKYLFEEDDGSFWVNLNQEYYGEVQFKMMYKDMETEWFNWLYIDFEKLSIIAKNIDLRVELIYENGNNSYLARITK